MDRKSERLGSGLGLPTLLSLIFLVLKLTHVIDWSWAWVLSPVWISVGLAVIVLIFVMIVYAIGRKK